MKLKFLISSLFVLIILVFAGCQTQDTKTNNAKPLETGELDQIVQTQLLQSAIAESNEEKCDLVSNETAQKECKQVIAATKTSSRALEMLDEKLCDQIELEIYQEACRLDVVGKLQLMEQEANKQQEQAKIDEQMNLVVEAVDINGCQQFEGQDNILCKRRVIDREATDKSDPSICEKHEQVIFVEACKEFVDSK